MTAPSSFITQIKEQQRFERDDLYMRRHAGPLPPSQASATGRDIVLEAAISQRLRALRRGRGFSELVCIGVADGDGMTWTAEAVAGILEREHGQDPLSRSLIGGIGSGGVVRLSGGVQDGRLPAIEHLVGRGHLLDRAVVHGLAPRFLSFSSVRCWMAIGATVATGATTYVVAELLQTAMADGSLGAFPLLLATVAAAAVALAG
jgi:hypothetical protein